MPKRKSITGNAQRKKDAERKRQKRRESCHQLPPDEAPSESSAPHGDIGVAAPGPECGSIGLPPSTLKPLARVQASPSEKMHSAPRLAPPRGSRLIAPKRKVASPDSPAWVCAPARVPESDIWMMSDSAGQAQLIPPKGEMVSKALKKDVGPREGKKGPREGKKGPIQNTMKSNERTIKQKDKKIEQIEKIQKQNENTIEEIEKTEKQNEKTIEQIEKREKQNENTIEQIEKTEKQNEKTIEQIEKTEKQIEKSEKQKEKTIEQMEKTEKQNKKITEQIEKTEKQNGKAMEQIEKTEKQMEKTLRQKNDTIEQKEMINLSKSQTCSKITNVHDIIGSGYDALNVSVQGSFHQADAIFGETAGTQCVANSLTALAYQKVKMSEEWETRDMNKILTTGDEMYTFIQRSSSMANRYLLITELPQFFECYERMFEFKANESLPSLINLENIELNYADFNAYELFEALQIALDGTDGCFVCFGGNTFLVGKSGDTFFTFDSHSRSCEGFQSECGRSTRILYDSVQGVYNHIVFLALSMGFSAAVECEITGVQCSIRQFELETQGNTEIHQGQLDGEVNQLSNCTNPEDTTTRMTTIDSEDSDDIDITRIENASNMFLPLSAEEKEHICNILGISYAFSEESENEDMAVQDLTEPLTCVEIEPDGNCFFRAISMFLTKKQDFHQKIRSAVCSHLLENAMIFKSFLRLGECSVENHISLSGMSEVGNWATEVEILALSHLIKTDVYTYTGGRWVTYSGQMVNPHLNRESSSGIYLYHRNQNHYDVVTRVAPGEAISLQKPVSSCTREYRKRVGERNRKRQKRNPNKVCKSEDICRYDKNLLQKNTKYRMDPEFKLKLRAYTNKRYKENEQYRESLKESSSHKYKSNPSHKQDVKEKSKQKYKTNQIHKENMKSRSILKYRTDEIHKETLKQRSKLKYDTDELHKQDVKQRSKTKYRTDEQHQQKVKTASKTKYKTDEQHQQKVKTASKTKYKMDEQHQQKVKTASKTKYKTDEKHQQKVKTASKVKYHSSADSKEEVKKYVQKRRIAMQHMLKDIDEVVTSFKHSVKQGPEYTCCCCHRIFFENQVQGCAIETYEKRFKALEVANLCINTKYVHDCGKACPVKCPKSRTWICYTCHRKILNGDVPAEAAYNKMCLEMIPPELNTLNTLEQHLIALHIPFMKVMMLPKGGQQNVHGPVVCVPSNLKKTTSLPLNANENLLLRVKLKRRLSYKGYYEYQFVNPNHIKAALNYLKENNKWYENVEINSTWEKDFDQSEFNQPEMQNEQLTEEDKDTNPEVVTDTCLQPVDIAQEVLDHYFDDVYNIAPGEGHNPIRMLQEEGNEAKTFPHLFPSGKFSWNDNRDVKISLSRYFNNRLMNADNRFAKDTNYIFFCQYLSELKQVIDKTQISIRKSVSKLDGRKPVTAEMLQNPEVLSKLLKTDEAMRFMQPIRGTPAYCCIVYIISYISKAEREIGMLLKQTQIEATEGNLSARDTIKRIGSAYLNHREVSAQEAVYRVCNLKMKESSRKVIFIPVGENPTRLSKPLAQIKQHSGCKIGEHKMKSNDDHDDDDDGDDNVEEEDMWMTNIVERYESRPKLNLFHKMCLAEFCSDYRVLAKSQIPKVEKEGVYELRNGKGYVQKRTRGQPAVIRYPRFNKESASEKYYQCLLQLFLPYWNVKHLKPPGFDLYETFYETGHIKIKPNENLQAVKSIVESNHLFFSKNEAAMENAQETLELLGEPEDAWARLCPETELNRRECVNEKLETHQAETNEPAETANEIDSFTGTAAFNIGGNTIHHVFSLTKSLPIPYEPLKEQSLNGIRSTLDHLQILIIDEVSMVYKRLLYYIHERLVQVKKCKEPFGGVSIIAVGDFYQLPPVKQRKDERLYSENGSYPTDFWLEFFKIVELEEIMRQREDIAFANVLNSLRIRTSEEPMSNEAKQMLRECIREGPEDALHVYSTNQEANEYNLKMLRGNSEELVELHAKDYQRDKTTGKLTLRDKPLIGTKADGLSPVLLLAVNARVMLTRNICVEDGLVNGAMGFISNFEYKDKHPENEVESVGVIFDSKVTGKIQGRVTPKGNLVQIKRMEEDLREKNSKSVVRHQFPLKLSWACTAHKVQGMTAKKVVVNLDRTFSPGQAYVAMSRVTSKDGLFIETNNETVLQKKIYADLDVKLALLRMQKYLSDGNFENSVEIGNHKSILLLNVQSLRAHFQEVISDSRLTSADLICLTETWLRGNENVQDIEIPDFDFHHITREQCYDNSSDVFKRLQKARGGGVGVYKNKTNTDIFINALECKNIEGMSIKMCEDDTLVLVCE
ncbi:uncharacterized protein LOC144626544 [Crassostrea virginica]